MAASPVPPATPAERVDSPAIHVHEASLPLDSPVKKGPPAESAAAPPVVPPVTTVNISVHQHTTSVQVRARRQLH